LRSPSPLGGVAIRCGSCIETCAERALEEVVEFLNVARAMQGCPGEAWALRVLEIFTDLVERRVTPQKAAETNECRD